jgi:hypothetical protein
MYQMAIKYTNIFHCKTLQKFTQIVNFGLKIYNLATLLLMWRLLQNGFMFTFVWNRTISVTAKLNPLYHTYIHSYIRIVFQYLHTFAESRTLRNEVGICMYVKRNGEKLIVCLHSHPVSVSLGT